MNGIKTYNVAIEGLTPLLMHADNIDACDMLSAYRKKNKAIGTPGDDRSPAWSWQTYLYFDDNGDVCIPASCVMATLAKAGAQVTLKGNTTFKKATQSGLMFSDEFLEFQYGPENRILSRADVERFTDAPYSHADKKKQNHIDEVRKLGFELFAKRAKIGTAKHVRVRPRFRSWHVFGVIEVLDSRITEDHLIEIFAKAGAHVGLCDWRPGSPTSPGCYGKFTTDLEEVT